jgi:hypothetical protein
MESFMEKPFALPILCFDRKVQIQRADRMRNAAIGGMVRDLLRVVRRI